MSATLLDPGPCVSAAPVVATQFRSFFRGHAAGVAIITAHTPQGPVGFTASSLASVSASPPMISFNVSRSSSSWAALGTSTHVAVHRLTAADADLADRFARSGTPRFDGVPWSAGAHGVPVLHGPRSWLVAAIDHRVDAGDSCVLIAQVLQVDAGTDDRSAAAAPGQPPAQPPAQPPGQHHPLVYATGGYARALPLGCG